MPEHTSWINCSSACPQLTLRGEVVRGFGRGSADLGCPTANLDMTLENKSATAELVPGIYKSKARLHGVTYPSAVSIGWNPTYEVPEKVIEAAILHKFDAPFYGELLELELESFIRAEALFSDFDSLILAIQCDLYSVIKN